jgi:osmotically-inducible protein OsmY
MSKEIALEKSKCVWMASAVSIFSAVVCACALDPSADDARITAQVGKAIAQHPDLGPPNQIYVDTRAHVVYLTGEADSGLTVANAQDVAQRVPGVIRVVSTVGVEE